MKRAKLLSLFLAGSLLLQSAGMDAMAAAPSESAPISQTDESADSVLSGQPSEEGSPVSSEGENDPSLPSGENADKAPSGEEDNSGSPSKDEAGNSETTDDGNGKSDIPAEDQDNSPSGAEPNEPETPEGDSGETQAPPEEDVTIPEIPVDENEEGSVPAEETDAADSVSENTVPENTVSENTLPEEETDIFSIFPGLGDDYKFSTKQLSDKRVLAAHVGDVVNVAQLQSVETATIADYPDTSGEYKPDEVVYLAKTQAEAEQVAEAFGGTLDSYSYEVAVITLPQKATVALAIAAAADPDTKLPAVWPNYYQYLHDDPYTTVNPLQPSDPDFSSQWQHDYIGTRYAWAAGFKGQGIKVGVIDTGLAMNHEDLTANALAGRNFVDGAEGTPHTTDNGKHGTHVAGIIAADDNDKGGVGIAPDAQVIGYCVFPASEDAGADSADVMRAVSAAVADGCDIINMSLGSPNYEQNYEKVVTNAYNKGVAIFASSGNDDSNGNNFPAAYANTISVGAVDENSTRASFSNYGSTVTLSFPGVEIYSTVPSGYDYMSGTSQASPAAAGTAAVILSAREDIRKKTGKDKVNALLTAMKSSTTKCATSGMGAGTTYLPGVLKLATDMTAPDAPVIDVVNETAYKRGANKKDYLAEGIEVTISSKTAVGVDIYYSTNGKTPAYKNGTITNVDNETPYAIGVPITLTGAKTKTIKAIAVNPVSGKASKVVTKTVTLTPIPTGVNVAPADNVQKIAAGKSLKFTAAVTPAYAISNKVAWSVVDADNKDAKPKGVTVANGTVKTSASKTLKTPAGEYTVIATAVGADGKTFNGIQGSYRFTVIDAANIKKVAFLDAATKKAPAAKSIKTTDSKTTDAVNKEIDLKSYLTVTTTDPVSKTDTVLTGAAAATEVVWSSSNKKVATVADGVITAVAPGKATIKAISNDGSNKSASYSVTVLQPVTKITISGFTKVAAGKSIALTAKVEPANASNKKLTWTIKDGGTLVTINKTNGRVTTKKDATGTYTITATAADGLGSAPATWSISIANEEITKITLNEKKLTMFPPKTSASEHITDQLTAKVEGKAKGSTTAGTLANPLITWTSSAPSVASVDQTGLVTAKAPGKATITCAAADGSNKKATCAVTVTVPMSKLVIGPTDGNYGDVAIGKKIKMAAKYYSNYGTPNNKKIVWQIAGYGNTNLVGKVSIDKNNGTVSVSKNMKPEDLSNTSYIGIQAVAQDGSGVTSNTFFVYVQPNFIAARISFQDYQNSYSGFFYIEATAYKTPKGQPDWSKAVLLPDYCTAQVTGPKNSGLVKDKLKLSDNGPTITIYQPMPTNRTTLKLDDDADAIKKLAVKDLAKMTLTVKLKDGSNLTAKDNNIYAVLYPKQYSDGIRYTIGYFRVKKVYV